MLKKKINKSCFCLKISYILHENVKKMNKKGYVYLLADNLKEGIYKIGVTRGTIENRIKKLQTGNAGELYMCKYYQTNIPFFVEKHLHLQFFSKNVKNEWFELSDEEVLDFYNRCAKIEEMYMALEDNYFFNKNNKKEKCNTNHEDEMW